MTQIVEAHFRVSGQYQMVLNEGTDREVATPWFDNIVTNGGLDRLSVAGPSVLAFCSVGTGTNAAVAGDTALQTYLSSVARTSVGDTSSGASAYVLKATAVFTWALGAVVGNLAEVGISWVTGGGSLFSRARIMDGAGASTTLTVTAADQLTVRYALTFTVPMTDITGSVTLSGTSYGYTGRPAGTSSWAGLSSIVGNNTAYAPFRPDAANVYVYQSTSVIGAITGYPSGTSVSVATVTPGSYTSGTFTQDHTISWSTTQGNASGGIKCMSLRLGFGGGSFHDYQYSFGTVIPKDNTKTMTMVMRSTWGR